MSDEIKVDGNEHVPSKRASKLSGYTQDYIGQLARGGYITGKRVGGLWYISMESLLGYKENATNQQTQHKKVVDTEENKPILRDSSKRISESLLTYLDDSDRLLLPDIHKVTTHGIQDQGVGAQSNFQAIGIRDTEDQQVIPIHKKASEKTVPQRFPHHTHPPRKSMSYGIFPAALTIIIILSLGLSSLKDNSRYTVNETTSAAQPNSRSTNNSFLAATDVAENSFEKLGSIIESLFVSELVYKRS